MVTIGLDEARADIAGLLDRVERGEDVLITREVAPVFVPPRYESAVSSDNGIREAVDNAVAQLPGGQRVAVDTFFKDFREVAGVMQPHRVETMANGRLIYVMVIDRMEANPVVGPEVFTRPGR